MSRIFRKGILLAALFVPAAVCFEAGLCAQEVSSVKGGLSGIITDPSGAVIPGATVTLSGSADKRSIQTDGAGRFSVGGLTPGLYTVSVGASGFSSTQAKNIEILVSRYSTLNLSLKPGSSSETVEVSANAVSVDTTSTAVGESLTATFYQQVPVARNVGSLFYVSPGVTSGGGTGNSNPSIGGSTGLENQYIADGVSMNDPGYGGIGVFSPIYGSLGTGINLSFIQEVQVKTGAFEPKYGKANGGTVQIVTKSGGSQYHGALAAYFAPEFMGAQYRYLDAYRAGLDSSYLRGRIFSNPAYDASIEMGGYIPIKGKNNKLFFFGAFNPSLNQVNYLAPNTSFSAALFNHGPYATSVTAYSWAGKLTYKINEGNSLEVTGYGDPSQANKAYNGAFTSTTGFPNLNQRTTTAFSRWDFGSRSIVARLNGMITPTTTYTLAVTDKTSHFTESGFANAYSISDRTVGTQNFQGLGSWNNPDTKNYGASFDIEKVASFFGTHTLAVGYGFDRTIYNATRDYSGPRYTFPTTNATGTAVTSLGAPASLVGASASAGFYLSNIPTGTTCPTSLCPNYVKSNGATGQVYLRQVRGYYSGADVNSGGSYHSVYANDAWSVNRYITISAGFRWEEEQMNGPNQAYVFNDNWSPRLGITVDPFGDRKSKVFFNYGRYTQALPYDAAIRELNQELDVNSARWAAPADASGKLKQNADGTITPILDAAHLLNGVASGPFASTSIVATPLTPELISAGTKLNYEEEYVIGIERQLKAGMVFSVRWTDRQLRRIVEDMQGVSPEGANHSDPNQIYLIGNPSPSADYFVNEQEIKYTGALPSGCNADGDYGPQTDALGNDLGYSVCSPNWDTAGATTADGKGDGFARAKRRYQSLEVELNKNFSHNYLFRANYRYAKLFGNYEGLFRNDNGQSDPGISSLFDFTTGIVGLLGSQFEPGYLNTDVRHTGNLYGSYMLSQSYMKNLTVGAGLRGSSGMPLNKLTSHPVYGNTGEIPQGGRGSAGRLPSTLQLDLHADYPFHLGEKRSIKFAFDAFNVANSKFVTGKNQNQDIGFLSGNDASYGTPISTQRPFYARGSIRFEF